MQYVQSSLSPHQITAAAEALVCKRKGTPTSCSRQCAEMKEPHDGAVAQVEMLLCSKPWSLCFLVQIYKNSI